MQRDSRAFLWDASQAAGIHGYATVNSRTVWNVAQSALPPLLVAVQSLLDELA